VTETLTAEEPTLLDAITRRLRACRSVPEGVARPVAILWTDPGREWLPLLEAVKRRVPDLLSLGAYAPEERTGPAIWLRCVVEGTVQLPGWSEEGPPVLYLPGVGRQDLRAGEDCPRELQPLVELMYRGTLWLQRNGYDWTLTAFLTSDHGLGLDIARDQETLAALPRALPEIAETPLEQMRAHRLEAEDFDRLLTPDLHRELLRWMSAPGVWRERMGESRWEAFRGQCRARLDFDPELDGELTAGERLGGGEGPWADVWSRFEEAPGAYPGLPSLLKRSRPHTLLFDRSRWPDENEAAEAALRSALTEVPRLPPNAAADRVLALERDHAERRAWVWARMGQSPLAGVLSHLATIARDARQLPGGASPDEIADSYESSGWRADAAGWKAMAAAPLRDEAVVAGVVRALLADWLDRGARVLQKAVHAQPLGAHDDAAPVEASAGGCVLFVDGLRYDLGRELAARLEGRGCRVRVSRRWAALPTVTATAKPAASPAAGHVSGGSLPADFSPSLGSEPKPATAPRLRSAIKSVGYQVLGDELGDWPATDAARGWTEAGKIDRIGHEMSGRLAGQIDTELRHIEDRILQLLDAGWASVRVVTDHGWLLLPGGLPRVDLPRHLTESRWARCACISGASQVSAPTFPWHWNPEEHFATAPGIACFNLSPEYAHGGISLQECVIPDLVVERADSGEAHATVDGLTWRGMRCVVDATASGGPVRVDLRLGGALGPSVAASVKALDADGRASLVVPDDKHEGAQVVVVLLSEDGTILAQKATRAGEPQ
jgi:hypothetical protein